MHVFAGNTFFTFKPKGWSATYHPKGRQMTIYNRSDKPIWDEFAFVQMSKWVEKNGAPRIHEGKLNEGPKIKKGDIKKGMFVWFSTDGKGAKKLKVTHLVPALGGHEYHYITRKGTFTPDDVVGY